jgi:hypothetical protein
MDFYTQQASEYPSNAQHITTAAESKFRSFQLASKKTKKSTIIITVCL